jgi:hypothetical protein
MISNRLVTAALAACSIFAVSPAAAQSYTVGNRTGSFSSIAGQGSPVSMSGADDGYGTVTLPFSFSFFGQTYPSGTSLYPSTNGALVFDAPNADLGNTVIPSSGGMNAFIAAFWDDLVLGSGGVYSYTSGVTGSRTFVVEWYNVSLYGATTQTLSFQVRLIEGSNLIEVSFGPNSGSGGSASIGVEDASGSLGAGASCNPSCSLSSFSSSSVVTFTPGSGPPVGNGVDLQVTSHSGAYPSGNVSAGASFNFEVLVRNNGNQSSSYGYVGIYVSTDATIDEFDDPVGEGYFTSVAAGSSQTVSVSGALPTAAGAYYIGALADYLDDIVESVETNNAYLVSSFQVGGGGGPQITITTSNLPAARAGSVYSARLSATGSPGPTWSVVTGSLPSGINLGSSGALEGTAFSEGTFSFRVQASEPGYTPGYADLVLTVRPQGGLAVGVSTPNGLGTELPQAIVRRMYTANVAAEGGVPPYAFQVVSGAPGWLFMNSQGQVSGTPDGPGTYELNVSVFDSASNFAEGTLLLEVIEGGPLTIEQQALPAGVTNVPYSARLAARGGVTPYRWTISSGQLPAGLNLDAEGTISGVPTQAGRASFEAQVQDAEGATQSASYEIEVSERVELTIGVPENIGLRYNEEASFQLTAQGGVQPYTWRIDGTLPAGLYLDADTIRGTPTSSTARSTVLITVTDRDGASASRESNVSITTGGRETGGRNSRGGGSARNDRGGCTCVAPKSTAGGSFALLALALVFTLRASLRRRSVVREGRCPRFTIRRTRVEPRSSAR